MAEIKEALRDLNPWWKADFTLEFKQREIYSQLQKFLPLPQIIALTGLRRVGKTTILFKIAEDYLKKNIPPRNILYFSFDEFKDVELRKVLQNYEELTDLDLKQGKFVVLFDEIQKVSNWENQLKSIYDLWGKRIKIVISGSESLIVKKKLKETLAGRIFEFKVEPLTFREFLHFKDITYKPSLLYEKESQKLLKEYTQTMGFPELISITDKEIIKKYIRESIVEKIIYRDLPQLYNIKNVSIIESLLNIFIEEPGQLVEISGLAQEFKLSRQTLSNYLQYLEDSFLLKKLYNFSKSRRKVERKLKKYYPTILSPDLLFKEDTLSKSKVFEWLLATQLKSEFFWRDPQKHEVDLILVKEKVIPVEIKFGKIEWEGLLVFMKKFNLTEGIIISYTHHETKKIMGKTIKIIPAYIFLAE